jgi:hypothetical protein
MKGAGGSFGIATQMHFQTFPIPKDSVTYFSYKWTLKVEESVHTLSAFQDWSRHSNVPKELGIEHQLRAAPNLKSETLLVTVTGSWYGVPGNFKNVINPLLAYYPSNRDEDVRVVSYLESLVIQSDKGTLDTSKPDKPDNFYAKSLVVPENSPMSDDAISNLMHILVTDGPSSKTVSFVHPIRSWISLNAHTSGHRIGSLRLNYGEESNPRSILFPPKILLSSNGHHYSSHSSMHHASSVTLTVAVEPVIQAKESSSLTVRQYLLHRLACPHTHVFSFLRRSTKYNRRDGCYMGLGV